MWVVDLCFDAERNSILHGVDCTYFIYTLMIPIYFYQISLAWKQTQSVALIAPNDKICKDLWEAKIIMPLSWRIANII